MWVRLLAITILSLTIGTMFMVVDTHSVSAAPLNIINGANVQVGEQPGVVGILLANVTDLYEAQFCGGTLVANDWVLTAAHCTFDMDMAPFAAADLNVLLGSNELRNGSGQRVAVDRIVRHADFDFATYYNDIALLHLSESVDAQTTVVANAGNAFDTTNVMGTVMGWGVTEDGYGATSLKQAELPIISQESCAALYAEKGYVVGESMICAGYETGGIDACSGDSGGPLFIWDVELAQWTQIGIVSAGAGCAEPGYYGLYTNVVDFAGWISAVVEA